MAVKYTDQIFGGTAVASVSTFGNLPAAGITDQRIIVTGESSLFSSSYPVICVWETSQWKLESARCTYLVLAAAEFGGGVWTGTGASLNTSSNCKIVDTTYNESWTWNSTNYLFVPSYLGLTAIQNQQKIKGDSTTLEAGWTLTVGTNCTATTSGGKLILSGISQSSPTTTRIVSASFTDAGQTNSTNFYMKCLMKSTLTRATTGSVSAWIQYQSATTGTGNQVEFGSADDSTGPLIAGKFMDRTTNWKTLYTATANRGDILTSETLVQFRTVGTSIAQVKVGSGGWHDISKTLCRISSANYFYIAAGSQNSATNTAVLELRYLQAIRYT
jgi:hypothetical protein